MASAADLTNTLLGATRNDPSAEPKLRVWCEQNFAEFAFALATEVGAPNRPPEVRQMAALFLKNTLHAKSVHFLQENQRRWKAVDQQSRGRIKEALLQSMASVEPQAAHSAAIAAAEVAAVELPFGEWADFVPALMERVTNPAVPEIVKLAALNCLGFTAERIAELEDSLPDQPELATYVVDKMLTTIVDGVQPSRSDPLRKAAIIALKNSLAFVRKNMEVKSERDFIMNAICEATRSSLPEIRQLAFQCMDQIADYYYDKLQDYMTTFFQLTTEAIKSDGSDDVKSAAIEFWSTIAFAEQGLLDEEREYQEEGRPLDRMPCQKYTQSALEVLTPLLLMTLTHQDEDPDDDEWNLQMAGAVCLETISATVEDAIVPFVVPFVEANINNQDWRFRDAAIVAFASILEGPATGMIGPFVGQAIPILLGAFNDSHEVVRDSAVHSIARICGLHILAVAPEMLHNIIQALISKLGERPRVASHACTAIFNIAQALKTPEVPESNLLSAPMLPLLQNLMAVTDRGDAMESNLRVSAMSAAAELINASARDVHHILRDFLPTIGTRIEAALKQQPLSADDQEHKAQLLGLLCALVSVLFQRLEKDALLMTVDQVMKLLLLILQGQNSTSTEEALLAVGAVASAMEEDFARYLSAFMPILIQGLRALQFPSLCIVSVGVVVDVCTAVGNLVQPYCDKIMSALQEALRDASVSREVKPAVISCFGDVAMAIGAAYEPYLGVSVMMLMQAAGQSAPAEDEDLAAFVNSLRLSILEAYSGITMGLADGNALQLFLPHVSAILQFLQFLASPGSNKDDDVLQKAVALAGDIAQQMGSAPQVRQQLNQPFVSQLIQEAGHSNDPSVREIASWTQNVLQNALRAG